GHVHIEPYADDNPDNPLFQLTLKLDQYSTEFPATAVEIVRPFQTNILCPRHLESLGNGHPEHQAESIEHGKASGEGQPETDVDVLTSGASPGPPAAATACSLAVGNTDGDGARGDLCLT